MVHLIPGKDLNDAVGKIGMMEVPHDGNNDNSKGESAPNLIPAGHVFPDNLETIAMAAAFHSSMDMDWVILTVKKAPDVHPNIGDHVMLVEQLLVDDPKRI